MSDTRPFRELLFWDFTDVTLASRDTWWSVIKHIRLLESILWTQRRCPKCWECWSPCVSQGPAGALQWGLDPRCYLLTIYVAQRPYRSPAQPAAVPPPTSSKHSLPTPEPTKGSQEVLDKNKNKARTRLPSYLRTNQRIRTRQDEGKVNVRAKLEENKR